MASGRYQGPIVDVDIHHRWKNDQEIVSYLPKRWQEYVAGAGRQSFALAPPRTASGALLSNWGQLTDSFPLDGSPPASDYDILKTQLLDRYGYFRGILTHQLGEWSTHLNHYFARALCSAINDWNADVWLTKDERLYSLLVVPSAVPEEAAEEVHRAGKHSKILGVLLAGNPLGRPFGDPLYHPIYKAATDLGLAISIHPVVSDRPNQQILSVGGTKSTSIEMNSQFGQQAMHYITSLIVHGVFEKFPDLTVTFKEYGVSWLPSLVWRLDQSYELLKFESPWVRRWPSEYIHRHIKLSTQPIEESPDDKGSFSELLQTLDGMEEMLCFSTDYPHMTFDEPSYVARLLPEPWLRKVFCDNACAVYGWTPPALHRSDDKPEAVQAQR
jgi:predicted TIM-barrel fold metal-dependent hydrolase